MKKILLMLLLVFALCSSNQVLFAVEYQNEAETLKTLGLFSGTDKGFELERAPKRVEAAAMLVKFLGKEALANEKKYTHPFTDVPTWANNYVGYLYHEGMTNGMGNNKFGSSNLISARDFTVFMLKSLGYTDQDFNYKDTLQFALSKGLLSETDLAGLNNGLFTRDKMVHVSYNSLSVKVKGETVTLKDKLIDQKVIKVDVPVKETQPEVYTVDIPYSNAEKITYKDDFLLVSSYIRDAYVAPMNEVGKVLEGKTDDGRDFYFELNSKFTSWDGYNLIAKVSLIKNGGVIYTKELITRTYVPLKNGTIKQGFVISPVAFDSMRVEITPIKNRVLETNIPITYLTTSDSEIVKSKIASSYAFTFKLLFRKIFDGNQYGFEEALVKYLQVERSWESISDLYGAASNLITNYQTTYPYEVTITGGSATSIGYPPNSGSTVKVDLGMKDISMNDYIICLYDSNHNMTEILVIK